MQTLTSSAGRDRQSFNRKNHRCKKSTVLETFWPCWQEIHRHTPLIYLKCWKKSSAFHCRCHFLKQWTDINDYCLKNLPFPYPHCWLKIHCVHQTTIHRADHYCRNPPLFPLLEKIQGYTLFISVAAKMPLLFIVKSMTGRNLSSSTNKSLWRKTRKELNSRPFLSLREQRKPSETKRVPCQVRSEAWSMERPSFWSKCSKT